jgi:hypothetical protein
MTAQHKYIMMVLDYLPDGACRIWWWNCHDGLSQNQNKATRFATAKDCQDTFDDNWGDSFLQGEYGDILTFDRTIGTCGDYTYKRFIIEI